MAAIVHVFDFLETTADPRVKDWLFMSSAWYPIIILTFYLYFVKKLGPRIMKNYKPFHLKTVIMIYNVFQVLINGYFVFEAFNVFWIPTDYNLFCLEVDYSLTIQATKIASVIWKYHVSRFIDLFDTVFFILRKKEKQATFLHVCHHAIVYVVSWIVVKYTAGGIVIFLGTINTFVHAVMYTYYLLTATIYSGNRNAIWWKKYLTQLQMTQFVLIAVHGLISLFVGNCGTSKTMTVIGIALDVFLLSLFWDFYKNAYSKHRKNENELIGRRVVKQTK